MQSDNFPFILFGNFANKGNGRIRGPGEICKKQNILQKNLRPVDGLPMDELLSESSPRIGPDVREDAHGIR